VLAVVPLILLVALPAMAADVRLLSSTDDGLRLSVSVPAEVPVDPQPAGRAAGGIALPFVARLLAAPPGARLQITVRSDADTLLPAPASTVADSAALPIPTRLVESEPLGWLRGVPAHSLRLYPWQVDPSGAVRVHTRLRVDVRFVGGQAARRLEAADASELHDAFLNPPGHGGWVAPRAARRATAASSYDASRPWLRLTVETDGVHAVTGKWLSSAGIDTAGIDPRTFALYREGAPLPVVVEGEADGRFDPDDRLLFVGRYRRATAPDDNERDHESLFGARQTYWLTWGGEPGRRYAEVDATPVHGYARREWFDHVEHVETDHTFQHLFFAPDSLADRWFWPRRLEVKFADRPSSQTYAGFAPGLWDEDDYEARVTVALQAETAEGLGEHHTAVHLNGNLLEQSYWRGQVSHVIDQVVPSSWLRDGTNRVLLQGWADRIPTDFIWFNWFRLEYRRRFEAIDGRLQARLPATVEGHRLVIDGLRDTGVLLLDPDRGLRLTGGTVTAVDDSLFRLTVEEAPEAAARYVVADSASIRLPTSGVLDAPSDWRSGSHGADYVVIVHGDLADAAQRLADHRQQRDGLSTAVVLTQDIYDEWSDGRFDPEAIRAFVQHTYDRWQPRPAFVVLFGDDTWDYRGLYTGLRDLPAVPTTYYLARRRGYSPSDFFYSLTDGDDLLADLSVGRLSTDSLDEAQALVDKIIAYDDPLPGDWRSRALYAANWHAVDEFSAPLDSVAARYTEPLGLTSIRHYAEDEAPLPNPLGAAFVRDFADGALIANFSGHGASFVMQYLFSVQPDGPWDYLSQVTNGRRLPLMVALSCLNGQFADPHIESLSEVLTAWPEGGTIAYISAAAVSFTAQNELLQDRLYSLLFDEGVTQFGPALDIAKARMLATRPSFTANAEGMQLTGDPAQRLALAAGPQYAVDDLQLADSGPVVPGRRQVTAVVRNDTRLGASGPTVRITAQSPQGRVDTLLQRTLPPLAGRDTLRVDWPVADVGSHRLVAIVEPSGDRLERHVDVVAAPVATPFLPAEGAIVGSLTLTALTPVHGEDESPPERVQFALSTDPAFVDDSTELSAELTPETGRADWTVEGRQGTLFWRVRALRDGLTSPWSAPRSVTVAADGETGATWQQAGAGLRLSEAVGLQAVDGTLVTRPAPPPFRMTDETRDIRFTRVELDGVGVLATDGVYLYVKRWFNDPSTIYPGTDVFTRVGTGFGGTVRGGYYGAFSDTTTPGISATVHDGYLYSDAGRLFSLERIDTRTGVLDTVAVPDGLLDWRTGRVLPDSLKRSDQYLHALITSDGEQVYNVSMSSHLGLRVGWGVRVFDVDDDGWHLAREFVVPPTETGFTFEWTDGVIADGEVLYLIEYGGQRRVRAVSAVDGSFLDEWTSDQQATRAITGQYDVANDVIWLGDLFGSGMFGYPRPASAGSGLLTGPVVGPARDWDRVVVDGSGVTVDVQAPTASGWQSLAGGAAPLDLSDIDAQQHPRLRLVARLDTTGGSLSGWGIDYAPLADLEVAHVAVGDGGIDVAVRNRGLVPASAAGIDLATRSGRRLASQPLPALAPGQVVRRRFDEVATDQPLRVWLRPLDADADESNDRADVPLVGSDAPLRFRAWPSLDLLVSGDALAPDQGILVESARRGNLVLHVDGVATDADTLWQSVDGPRAVLRLAPGQRTLEARLGSGPGQSVVLHIDEGLDVRNVRITPNPVPDEGGAFTWQQSGPGQVTVDVYALSGRRVRRLDAVTCDGGFCSRAWDARTDDGQALAAGTYLFVVTARDDGAAVRRRGALVVAP
jgi:hypothetical protein